MKLDNIDENNDLILGLKEGGSKCCLGINKTCTGYRMPYAYCACREN